MTRKTYCGNLLWQSGLTLLAPKPRELWYTTRRMKRLFVPLTPIIAVALAAAAPAVSADEVPWNPYVVDRTVEVSPGARKNKAFPMEEGSALCDLHLRAEAPWCIRYSRIALRDDKTLWFKASEREYRIAGGYAPNEDVVVRGELEKSGGGSGQGGGEASAVSGDGAESRPPVGREARRGVEGGKGGICSRRNHGVGVSRRFRYAGRQRPKDDFHLSDPRVTLTWAPANAVKKYKGAAEVGSGVSWRMAGSQLELSVKAVRPGADVKFTLKGEPDVVSHERAVDYVRAMCAKVEFVTPAGDPVSAPKDAGDGQNEFTFSDANPGVLTMNLKAKVTPAAAAPTIAADCRFEVGAIGTSAMAWAAANPRGKATGNGGFLTATVAFTGLPDRNDAFGKKKAVLLLKGRKLDENDYEVFFPKNATNHPGGQAGSPNWFYYWNMVCGDPNAVFNDSLPDYGQFSPTNPLEIQIGNSAGYVNTTLNDKGIDCFAETVIHESTHRQHYRETKINGRPDSDGDWLQDSDERLGDLNLDTVQDTEDANGNGVLDMGEDNGLYRMELTLTEFNSGGLARSVLYGRQNQRIDQESEVMTGTSMYHANTRGGDYDDEDDTCYAAESTWNTGSADAFDWANPGKQTKSPY